MGATILITGTAGFIGYHCTKHFLEAGFHVVGIDNLNDYYNIDLKHQRLSLLSDFHHMTFYETDIKDKQALDGIFSKHRIDYVIHLAAQAGVRHSLTHPYTYIDANVIGFTNILEACKTNPVKHLIYASSSSVYGNNATLPFSEDQTVDHPVSLYAATKKSNELMAHVYSHLYSIPTTGVRLFTVYGPWGRPDMAYYKFAQKIWNDEPIDVYNHGHMKRDFTYVGDVVKCLDALLKKAPSKTNVSTVPYRILNIAGSKPYHLMDFIELLENALQKQAKKHFLALQPGDVLDTYGDVTALKDTIGYVPTTPLSEGLESFTQWFIDYHKTPFTS